jgi:hypothetical protein
LFLARKEARMTPAVVFVVVAIVITVSWKSAAARRDRAAALSRDIARQRERWKAVLSKVHVRPPPSPLWARKLGTSIRSSAVGVLIGVDRTLRHALRFAARRADAAEALLLEASATIDAVEGMERLANGALPEIVEEERRSARLLLGQVRELRQTLEAEISRRSDEGVPLEDELRRTALLVNALAADEGLIDADPRTAMATICRQAAYLVGIAADVQSRTNEKA